MANWAGLPTEILHSIFELLEGRMRDYERSWESFFPLYDCLLVCKNWTGPALVHLYRQVEIISAVNAEDFIECVTHSPHGRHLHTLLFCELSGARNTGKYLLQIANACPNVKHLEQLDDAPFYWNALSKVGPRRWRMLETVPECDVNNKKQAADYYKCILKFNQTLTRITVPAHHPKSEKGKKMVQEIKTFPKLETILVMDGHNTANPDDYDELIENCPHLKKICICIRESPPENNREPKELDIVPRSSVKNLVLVFNQDPIGFDYMMQKFPNLDSLFLGANFPWVPERQERMDRYLTEKMQTITQYISRVKNFEYSFYGPLNMASGFVTGSTLNVQFTGSGWDSHNILDDLLTKTVNYKGTNDSICINFIGCWKRSEICDLWRLCGHLLSVLTFEFPSPIDEHLVEEFNIIEDILVHCKHLREFEYRSPKLVLPAVDPERVKQPYLEQLDLYTTTMDPEILPIYSRCMPSLKSVLLGSTLVGNRKIELSIDMPETNFEQLTLEFDIHLRQQPKARKPTRVFRLSQLGEPGPFVVFKVEANGKKPKIYEVFIEKSKLFPSKRDALKEVTTPLEKEAIVTIHIRCRSIKHLSFGIGGFHMHNYPLNL
jgi:hypothetical protein